MNKTMKKITSIGVAATMVAATLTGAMAADLKNLPAPFVKDGVADFSIVVGAAAATSDVIGAIDIATAMQASSVSKEAVEVAGGASASVEGGVAIAQSGNSLILNKNLVSAKPRITKTDLPELLADGEVKVESTNKNIKYDQELVMGALDVEYSKSPADLDDPALFLNTNGTLWTYTLSVRGTALDFTATEDSESIEMLGKTFTIDPNIATTGNIVLYGSDETQFLELNQPKTVDVDGKSYTVAVVGGNSDGSGSVVLDVSGTRRTVTEGNTYTINGVEVFVKDIFVTNIPVLDASATVFVGSQKVELPQATTGWNAVEINGDSVNGLEARVSAGTDNSDVTAIEFRFKPDDLNNDVEGFDEVEFLLAGQSVKDPLFGTFEVKFAGPNYALDSAAKSMVDIRASGRNVELTFTNDDGDKISFTPFWVQAEDEIALKVAENGRGWVGYAAGSNNSIGDRQIFILQEGSSIVQTKVYEVAGFKLDNSVHYVRLRDLASGSVQDYKAGDQIGSSSVTVVTADNSAKLFNISAVPSNRLYLEGGRNYVDLSYVANSDAANITLVEVAAANDETTEASTLITIGTGSGSTSTDARLVASGTVADDDNKVGTILTNYGTYVVADIDTDRKYVKAWVPKDRDYELKNHVFVAPVGAKVTVSGSAVTRDVVNRIDVGAAVLDTNVNLATEGKNLIVVGGPCINSVAAQLLGNPESCTEGFSAGKAVIELFDMDNGNVAMLVAGYSAEDTLAATRAVSLKDSRLMGTSASLTVQNAKEYTVSTN